MGQKSVATEQGVSVTPHSSFILDWAVHTTGGMGESVVASSILNQTASYLAHSVAKRCTLIVIYCWSIHLYYYSGTVQYFVAWNEEGAQSLAEP